MYCIQNMKNKNAKSVFGKKLIELRQTNGLTQPQFASALNISRDTVAYYETKAKNPTSEFIQKVADYFKVPYDQLLALEIQENKKPGPASKLEKQFKEVQRLPKNKQKLVSEIIDNVIQASN